MFLQMISDCNMVVISTFGFIFVFDEFGVAAKQTRTRKGWQEEESQLEYVCCSRDLLVDHFELSRTRSINSDHDLIRAVFATHVHMPTRKPAHVISGWKPRESADANEYKKQLFHELKFSGQMRTLRR